MAITVERLIAEVEANPAGAIAALEALSVVVDQVARDRTAHIDLDVDALGANVHRALNEMGMVGSQITDALGGASQVLNSVTGAAENAADAAGGAGDAATKAGSGFSSMGGGVGSAVMQMVTAIPQLATMGLMLMGVFSAATAAAGAIQMLAASAAGLYAALFPLVGLLGAIPVGLGAIGGGFGSVLMGMNGVMDAMNAMDTAQAASSRSTYDAASAARQLKDARLAIVDANKAVERAERDLAKATAAVTQAYIDAADDIKDSRKDVRNAIWAEEDAIRNLKRAQENLAKAQAKVGKSSATLSRETDDFTGKIYEVARVSSDAVDAAQEQSDAQYAVTQAQRALTLAQERTADSKKRLNDLEKKGVAGSDKVQEALQRQADASDALAKAQENVSRATDRLAEVQRQQAKAAAGGGAANAALQRAMDKLSPTGREFVKFLHDEFMPAWRDVMKAAQEGLLPGVEKGLRSIMKVFPDMADEAKLFAKGMGDAFAEIAAHFTTKEMVADLKELGQLFRDVLFGNDKNKTKGIVDAMIPLGDILIKVTKAAGPMTKALTNGVVGALEKISAWMDKPKNAKRMEKFFTESYEMLKLWGGVLKPLAGIFITLSDAAKPLATWMLKGIGDWLTGINDTMKNPEGFKKLQDWFNDMKPAIRETAGFIKDLVKAFFHPQGQGKEDAPFTSIMKSLRTEFIPALEHLLDVLGTDNESGKGFVGILTSIVDTISALVENPERVSDFIGQVETLIGAMSDFLTKTQEFLDALAFVQKFSLMGITAFWLDTRRENSKGINEWEAYTRPRLENAVAVVAAAFNMIPIVGPILSKVFTFINKRWFDIIGIFTSGDIAGAIQKKFFSLATDVRRFFAKLLNPVIEVMNKVLRFLHLPQMDYIDSYAETGRGNTGKSTAGSGSGAYNEGAGTGSKPRKTTTTTTRVNPGLRAFGGPVEGGRDYIVGEKRPEVLRLPEGSRGRIAAAVPRPMQSTAPGMSEEQLDRILTKVLEKAKPNVDLKVEQNEHADPKEISRELVWALR